MANKQDLKECMRATEITDFLNIHDIKSHQWHVQECSAKSKSGVQEGLDWLISRLVEQS
jgi:ADP-ribosylation factor-like protein 5B